MRLKISGSWGQTHRLLSLFDTGLDLLECRLNLIFYEIDLVFADDGDGRLGGELFRARPAQAPVPSHSDGTRKRATTMGGGWVKWVSLGRSGHALSRSRSFVMKFDGWEGDIDGGSWGGSRQADGLTL